MGCFVVAIAEPLVIQYRSVTDRHTDTHTHTHTHTAYTALSIASRGNEPKVCKFQCHRLFQRKQEALLWQRDRALSIEILQLKTSYLKTRFPGLSCGVICVILRLAVFTQYRSVTDTHTQTDRRTDRYSIASRRKNRP